MSLLLEGGATLHAAAWEAGMIDRVVLFVAPAAIGSGGVSLFAGAAPDSSALAGSRVSTVGTDIRLEFDVHRAD
jgi:diaminohydroxyphosphoribosylaminopyrimidine deaminase/5-amino-6-(5-phosphoribosylamino)uracil reductase